MKLDNFLKAQEIQREIIIYNSEITILERNINIIENSNQKCVFIIGQPNSQYSCSKVYPDYGEINENYFHQLNRITINNCKIEIEKIKKSINILTKKFNSL